MDSVQRACELTKAAALLRKEYMENMFFRDAVIASIKSALREIDVEDMDLAANRIAERIFLG